MSDDLRAKVMRLHKLFLSEESAPRGTPEFDKREAYADLFEALLNQERADADRDIRVRGLVLSLHAASDQLPEWARLKAAALHELTKASRR